MPLYHHDLASKTQAYARYFRVAAYAISGMPLSLSRRHEPGESLQSLCKLSDSTASKCMHEFCASERESIVRESRLLRAGLQQSPKQHNARFFVRPSFSPLVHHQKEALHRGLQADLLRTQTNAKHVRELKESTSGTMQRRASTFPQQRR